MQKELVVIKQILKKIKKIMNFISPLTLLIVPLVGSILIMSIPYLTKKEKIEGLTNLNLESNDRGQKANDSVEKTLNIKIEGASNKNSVFVKENLSNNLNLSPYAEPKSEQGFSTSYLPLRNKGQRSENLNIAIDELKKETKLENKNSNLKKIAILTSLINFIISIILWIQFDSNYIGYQFVTEISGLEFIQLNLGVDGISLFFVLLTTFITPIALLSSHNDIEKNLKFYLVSILLLETLQIAVFVVLDLLLFYIFFESVLIPLFFIVGVWGASSAKVRAAFLLFLYTLFGSLFMLLAIIQVYSYLGATDFALLSVSEITLESQKILWLAFFLAFAIKTPLWPFTGWLFRAHVEAPLSGSVILAAVILKLATYAYLRIMISFLPDATHYYSPLLQGICIITLIYASLSALRSHDSKALVALSSISHCALIVLGLFSNTIIGIEGGILVSLGHGFISPALFIIVGGIIYNRVHSRVIQYIRGLTTYMPLLGIFFLVFALANASIPLTTGWVGEQMTLIGLFERSPIIGALGALSIFLTACYSVFIYNRLMFGTYSEHLKPLLDIDRREFIILFSLLVPTVVFGIWPNFILDSLHPATSELIYNIPTLA
jgi:NADH-ubiquinone oxidoreductase chain 4